MCNRGGKPRYRGQVLTFSVFVLLSNGGGGLSGFKTSLPGKLAPDWMGGHDLGFPPDFQASLAGEMAPDWMRPHAFDEICEISCQHL